jgi:hypothetical protein
MMSEASSRFALPFLLPGQAQKEFFHNEALALIDLALHPAVEADAPETPPAAPLPGQAWIVGAAPTGAWAGRAGQLAGWTAGGWRFIAPREGLCVWRRGAERVLRWDGAAWRDGIGGARAAPPSPSGGTTIDAEARAAIESLIATLKSHGLID